MSGIVCAIRGGPGSQPTIAKAITLAKETKLSLHFMYVVNLEFLTQTSSSRVHAISEEMREMGEFILLTAQSAASEQGVTAQGVIRQGKVREAIVDLCHEMNADYLVIGRPNVGRENSLFTHELLAKFIEKTEQETGAQVVMPEDNTT